MQQTRVRRPDDPSLMPNKGASFQERITIMSNAITVFATTISGNDADLTVNFNTQFITVEQFITELDAQHNIDISVFDIEDISGDDMGGISEAMMNRLRLQDGDTVTLSDAVELPESAASQAQAPAQVSEVAYATVTYGAGITNLNIAIVDGVTTVEEIATSSLTLARMGKTRAEILRCKFTIDGREVTTDAKLHANETLRIENRVAGDKGAVRILTIAFDDGDDIRIRIENEQLETLADVFADEDMQTKLSGLYHADSDDEYPFALACDDIVEIEGITNASMIRRLYASLPIEDGFRIVFDSHVKYKAPVVEFSSDVAQPVAETWSCTICLGSGINPFVRTFNAGSTIAEVLLDGAVLARLNQTEANVRNSRVTMNGTEINNLNTLLDNNACVRVEARVAGDKGQN